MAVCSRVLHHVEISACRCAAGVSAVVGSEMPDVTLQHCATGVNGSESAVYSGSNIQQLTAVGEIRSLPVSMASGLDAMHVTVVVVIDSRGTPGD